MTIENKTLIFRIAILLNEYELRSNVEQELPHMVVKKKRTFVDILLLGECQF